MFRDSARSIDSSVVRFVLLLRESSNFRNLSLGAEILRLFGTTIGRGRERSLKSFVVCLRGRNHGEFAVGDRFCFTFAFEGFLGVEDDPIFAVDSGFVDRIDQNLGTLSSTSAFRTCF